MSATARSDADLVGAARAGCADAFGELHDRHRARVTGVCARRLPAAEVDDVVQEAFVRAWQHLENLEDPARFGPWLRSIAVRAAADHARARRGGIAGVDRLSGLVVDDETAEVDERLDRRARADRVAASLPELRPRDRRALWLRDALGAPIPHVAEELGLTEASTRVMLVRARRRLRDAVGAIAVWIGALVGRRSASGVGSSVVPVAAVLGASLVVGVVGPALRDVPSTPPAPEVRADVLPDATGPSMTRAGDHPVLAAEPPVSATADRLAVADESGLGVVTTPPTDDDRPVVAPRVEQRPVRAEDPDRDVAVSSLDGFAAVGVYVGDELERLGSVEVPTDRQRALDDARAAVGGLIGAR